MNEETFHSVPLDTLAHIHDDETSAVFLEFPLAPVLPEGPQIVESPYFDEDQHGSGSCVPHAVGTALEIKLDKMKQEDAGKEHISRMFLYRQRSNYPSPGSSPYEMVNVLEKKGWIPFDELPTPATEELASALVVTDKMYLDAKANADGYTVKSTPIAKTEEAFIGACMSGEPILLTFVSSIREWRQEFVNELEADFDHKTAAVCHEQVIMPNSAFTKDGKTYFTTAESAHIAGLNHHHFSWDFLSKRMYNPLIMSVSVTTHNYPKYVFAKNLGVGAQNEDVLNLQRALIADGCLEDKYATGLFGNITLGAVRIFQKKYNIPATGFVGQMTRGKLNELCK